MILYTGIEVQQGEQIAGAILGNQVEGWVERFLREGV
jgi:hypothetical protein